MHRLVALVGFTLCVVSSCRASDDGRGVGVQAPRPSRGTPLPVRHKRSDMLVNELTEYYHRHGDEVFEMLQKLRESGLARDLLVKVCTKMMSLGTDLKQINDIEKSIIKLLPEEKMAKGGDVFIEKVRGQSDDIDHFIDNFVAEMPDDSKDEGRDLAIKVRDMTFKVHSDDAKFQQFINTHVLDDEQLSMIRKILAIITDEQLT